jgi:hypothetical protein
MSDELLDFFGAGRECDLSHWTLRKHAEAGNISTIRLGRLVKMTRAEVDRIKREGLPSLKRG